MANLLKFVHIVAAILWIGGTFTLIVINSRLARSQNRAAMQAVAQQSTFYGRAVIGPAAGLTLLAGIGTALAMGVRFSSLWIVWGFAGIFLSMLLSGLFIRRVSEELSRQAAESGSGVPALQRRLASLNWVNLALLLSVVAAMVFKP